MSRIMRLGDDDWAAISPGRGQGRDLREGVLGVSSTPQARNSPEIQGIAVISGEFCGVQAP